MRITADLGIISSVICSFILIIAGLTDCKTKNVKENITETTRNLAKSTNNCCTEIDCVFQGISQIVQWTGLELNDDQTVEIEKFLQRLQDLSTTKSFDQMRFLIRENVEKLKKLLADNSSEGTQIKKGECVHSMTQQEFGNVTNTYLKVRQWFGGQTDLQNGIDAGLKVFELKRALVNKRYLKAGKVLNSLIELAAGPLNGTLQQTRRSLEDTQETDLNIKQSGESEILTRTRNSPRSNIKSPNPETNVKHRQTNEEQVATKSKNRSNRNETSSKPEIEINYEQSSQQQAARTNIGKNNSIRTRHGQSRNQTSSIAQTKNKSERFLDAQIARMDTDKDNSSESDSVEKIKQELSKSELQKRRAYAEARRAYDETEIIKRNISNNNTSRINKTQRRNSKPKTETKQSQSQAENSQEENQASSKSEPRSLQTQIANRNGNKNNSTKMRNAQDRDEKETKRASRQASESHSIKRINNTNTSAKLTAQKNNESYPTQNRRNSMKNEQNSENAKTETHIQVIRRNRSKNNSTRTNNMERDLALLGTQAKKKTHTIQFNQPPDVENDAIVIDTDEEGFRGHTIRKRSATAKNRRLATNNEKDYQTHMRAIAERRMAMKTSGGKHRGRTSNHENRGSRRRSIQPGSEKANVRNPRQQRNSRREMPNTKSDLRTRHVAAPPNSGRLLHVSTTDEKPSQHPMIHRRFMSDEPIELARIKDVKNKPKEETAIRRTTTSTKRVQTPSNTTKKDDNIRSRIQTPSNRTEKVPQTKNDNGKIQTAVNFTKILEKSNFGQATRRFLNQEQGNGTLVQNPTIDVDREEIRKQIKEKKETLRRMLDQLEIQKIALVNKMAANRRAAHPEAIKSSLKAANNTSAFGTEIISTHKIRK